MATISSPRHSGSIRGVEGSVKKILASLKKKSENFNQRPCVGINNSRKIHHRVRAADGAASFTTPTKTSMATIVSPRRSGSIRGVEGGVGKILASLKTKTENVDYSPLQMRIHNVSAQSDDIFKQRGQKLYAIKRIICLFRPSL